MLKQRDVHSLRCYFFIINQMTDWRVKMNRNRKLIVIALLLGILLTGCDKNDEISENSVLVERNAYIFDKDGVC